MAKHEGFWKVHGVEIALLFLVLFLTGMLMHVNSRLTKVSVLLEDKINRVNGTTVDIKARMEDRFDLLDWELKNRLVRGSLSALGGHAPGNPERGITLKKYTPRPDQSLGFRTIADPEIENLTLNWGILRRAFPKRLQDSKRAYMELIDQFGFPVTERQRMQMRKVVQETFGLVECITTSAGWEE